MQSLKRVAFTLFFVVPFLLGAQNLDLSHFKEIKPRSVGPAGMSGRVTTIDVVLNDPKTIYVGTASGGVWKSKSGGVKWEPIFDDQDNLSIGALTINQDNPAEIWVGTGEGNPRNSHNSGKGIYKSIDGGKTWKKMGLEQSRLIHRIYIHPENHDYVVVGVLGSAWGDSAERGVFITEDGGKTWQKKLYINQKTGVGDMVVDPSNPNKIIAAMWEFRRTPWDFVSGGKNSAIYISYDAGQNWKKIEQKKGLPKGDLGRIGLAFATTKPNIVYALVEAKVNGLYKSTDGGETWKLTSDKNIGNRPFYYSDIFVDPKNENRIYNLYSVMSRSEDGGKNFDVIAPYNYIHPDHHAFWIHPDDPDYIIEGNDGGINITHDGGQSWRFVSNLPVGQFYHVNVDDDLPYNIYGGMQDNGTWVGPAYEWKRGGIRNNDWQEVFFGDGFDCMPNPKDNRYVYAMSQGGNLGYVDRETGEVNFIRPEIEDTTRLRYNWNPGLAQDPFNDCGVYYGSQFLHYSADCGKTWKKISPDLTTNNPEKQQQDKSGGLTMDATFAENHTTIISVTPSSLDEDVIWVGTDDGNVQVTRDGGDTWKNINSRISGLPKHTWIAQIDASKHSAGEAFLAVNNYRQNDWSSYLYHTTDYGNSWKRIVSDSDVHGHVICVKQDPVQSNLVFVGTDEGLFFSLNKGQSWQQWTNGMPPVSIRDMVIQEREKDLVIGTFGRAFYVFDDIQFLRDLASNQSLVSNDLVAFQPPTAYLTSYRSYDGIRFVGDAVFEGDNRETGAIFTLWKKPKDSKNKTIEKESDSDEKENSDKKEEKKKDRVVILDSKNDTVRVYELKTKDGMNRIRWNLESDGVDFPSYTLLDKKDFKNSGSSVLPGEYKVYFYVEDDMSETTLEVKLNPNMSFTPQQYKAQVEESTKYLGMIQEVSDEVKKLLQARRDVKNISTMAASLDDDDKSKEIRDSCKSIDKKINDELHLVLTPEDFKGYDGGNRLTNDLFMTMRYVGTLHAGMTTNAQNSLNKTVMKKDKVMDSFDKFWSEDWSKFTDFVEKQNLSLITIRK